MLRVAVLLSLLCATGSALPEQDVGYGAYSYPAGAYSDEPVYGAPYIPQGGRSAGFGAGDMDYPPRGVSDPINDPYRGGPHGSPSNDSRYYGQAPGDGYQPYPARGEGMDDRRDGARRFDWPRDGADGYARRWGSSGELPPAAAPGYRFRGDAPAGYRASSASTWRGGYRFRPLTEQERERRGSVSGWRPRDQERAVASPGRPDPLPSEETYGYESDNWFRRYYRERP